MDISSSTLHTDILQSLHFLHIPKTAGTSLRAWLADLFSEGDWLPCYSHRDLEQFPKNQIHQYRLFSGHFGINWYDALPKAPHTFTWLRQPLHREISNYFYQKEEMNLFMSFPLSSSELKYINALNQLTLAELFQSPNHIGYYDNIQVRMLAGAYPTCEESPVYCDEAMLQVAKENLLNLFFFGICELMEHSIALFNYCLGCPPRLLNLNLNSRRDRSKNNYQTFSDEEIKIIQDVNRYDEALYLFARSMFEERFNNVFPKAIFGKPDNTGEAKQSTGAATLPQRIQRFASASGTNFVLRTMRSAVLNTKFGFSSAQSAIFNFDCESVNCLLRENFQRRQQSVPPLTSVDFDFSAALFLEGWHPRFYYEPIKKWLRWAGPTTSASIYLPLAKNASYLATFRIYYCLEQEVLETLTLQVEGQHIPLILEQDLDENGTPYYRMTAEIPESCISEHHPYTILTFQSLRVSLLKYQNQDNKPEELPVSFAMNGSSITKLGGVGD